MPFKSEAQRRWMWANEPGMAHRWASYGGGDAINVTITTDIPSIREKLRIFKNRAPRISHNTAMAMARDLVAAVQQHASGRPGPNVVTGAYRNSIRITGVEDKHLATNVFVGTDAPQAHRLEFGFVGVDRMGRHYHQPAFPHWRPGLQDVRANSDKYKAYMREALQ